MKVLYFIAGITLISLLFLNSSAFNSTSKLQPGFNKDSSVKTFLALGDSYTIGQSVAPEENFPNQLAAALKNAGINLNEPEIRAVTGWTTGNLISSLRNKPPQQNTYSLVTLAIGVNNQFQDRTITEYKIEFNYLLQEAVKYAGDKMNVMVLSIPDYGVTPFADGLDRSAISKEINRFNAAQKQICKEAEIKFIDVTSVSRQGKKDPEMQADDGLHPSAKQYDKWVKLMMPAAQKILAQ